MDTNNRYDLENPYFRDFGLKLKLNSSIIIL
nr:MAG TPA: hypothetical protein [Caudoviricetes sp.]